MIKVRLHPDIADSYLQADTECLKELFKKIESDDQSLVMVRSGLYSVIACDRFVLLYEDDNVGTMTVVDIRKIRQQEEE